MLFPLLGTPLTMGMMEATTNSKEIKAIGSGAALDCSITFLPVDASTTTAAANPSIASLQLMTSGAALHKNVSNPKREKCLYKMAQKQAIAEYKSKHPTERSRALTSTLEPHGVYNADFSAKNLCVGVCLLAFKEIICLALLWPKVLGARVRAFGEVASDWLFNFLQTAQNITGNCAPSQHELDVWPAHIHMKTRCLFHETVHRRPHLVRIPAVGLLVGT